MLSRPLVAFAYHQDIERMTMLINRTPQVSTFTVYSKEQLVNVPFVSWLHLATF